MSQPAPVKSAHADEPPNKTKLSSHETILELLGFLEAVRNSYITNRQRNYDGFVARQVRRLFIYIATLHLNSLIRRVKRLSRRRASADLTALMCEVFTDRRVVKSDVELTPKYARVVQTAQSAGDTILKTSTNPEQLTAAACMKIYTEEKYSLLKSIRAGDTHFVSYLPEKIRRYYRLDALGVLEDLEKTSDTPFDPKDNHIAYFAAMSLPFTVNGYSSRTEGIARAYQDLGFKVEVVTKAGYPMNAFPHLEPEGVTPQETLNGVSYHRIKEPLVDKKNYTAYARRAADAIEEKLRELKPAHVIAGSNYENSIPALLAARRLGLPFTYEVRGMWELTKASKEPGFEETTFFAVMQRAEQFVCEHADSVLTLTQPMIDNLVSRGIAREKIALMPNGVSTDMFETVERDDNLAQTLGIHPSSVVIGYAGAIKEYEGLQDLGAAAATLAGRGYDLTLLILGHEEPDGDGATPITDSIKQCFADIGKPDRLLLPGRVPFTEIKRFYALMDICPITRRGYSVSEMVSPIKPVEAMAQGKAVVLSDVEAMKFFSQNETTALHFRKNDVDHLTEILGMLIEDAKLRHGLGIRGRAFVEDQLKWSSICKEAAFHMGLRLP